jgi:hypothetical protein
MAGKGAAKRGPAAKTPRCLGQPEAKHVRHACGAKSVTTGEQGIGAKSVLASGSFAMANKQKKVEVSTSTRNRISTLARYGKNTATTASG